MQQEVNHIVGVEWFIDVVKNKLELIDLLKTKNWARPQNVNIEDRSNSVIYLMQKDSCPEAFNLVDDFCNSHLAKYRDIYRLPRLCYSSIEALRYDVGEHYVEHFDNGSPHVANRICSMVTYLNDNYEGGEIEFPLFDASFKPSAGSVVVFPSNYPYLHTVKPVTSGSRYALNVFFSYC